MPYQTKHPKPKTMLRLKIGDDVIYAKNNRELNQKLKGGVILWHYDVFADPNAIKVKENKK